MLLKIESDLHIDPCFCNPYVPNLDGIDVYVIAGDLAEYKHCMPYLKTLCEKYPEVKIVYVAGNHEYWGTYYGKLKTAFKEFERQHKNFHYLENDTVIINGIRFIGATLWTSFRNRNPIEMNDAWQYMKDYKRIRWAHGSMPFSPQISATIHENSKKFVFDTLNNSNEKSIIVTHHRMFDSGSTRFLSSAYETELREELLECKNKPIMCISGHCHEAHRFIWDDILFISNPFGYYGHENNTGFNPDLVVGV